MQKVRSKAVFMRKPDGKAEADAYEAVEAEENGDREKASKLWQNIKQQASDSTWARIADRRLAEWNAVDQTDEKFARIYKQIYNNSSEGPLLTDEREREAFLAWRMEHSAENGTGVGDLRLARTMFQSLCEKRDQDSGLRKHGYLYAAWHKHELTRKLEKGEGVAAEKVPLKERVRQRLDDVRKQRKKEQMTKKDAKFICLDILALYDQNKEMAEVVEEAKKLLEELSK